MEKNCVSREPIQTQVGFYNMHCVINLYFSGVAMFSGLKRPTVNVNFFFF